MKKLLPVVPLAAFLMASCQQYNAPVSTLPPVVEKRPIVSKPKKRDYRFYKSADSDMDSTATIMTKDESINPLEADPLKVTPKIVEIPRFEVPDNVQPKVSDGINQAEFIELKW